MSGSDDKTVRIWDVESGDCIKTLEGHTNCVNGVSFSPNNQYVVSGSDDKTVRIWDVESGDCIKTLEGHTSYVYSVSFSPNNQYVVSGSSGKTVRIWDVESGDCIKTLEGHTDFVCSVSFSPNNQYVVSGSDDNTVRVWDVESGDCIKTLEGHTGWVRGVSFSPNNQCVVSGAWDDTVRIWDVESGECIKTLEGHTKPISSIVFSPNNQYVLSKDSCDEKRIWNVSTGECLHVIKKDEPLPSEYQSHFTNESTSTNKIDLSLLLKDSTIVGLENGYDVKGSSNGMNAVAKESSTVHLFTLNFSNKKRRVAYEKNGYEDMKEYIRRRELGFNENNPWSKEKETKLKEQMKELVDLILLVFIDTAARLNIEFTNEHRIAVEKDIRSAINETGYVEMKEGFGEMKEGFTKIEETDFQEMIKKYES